MFSSQKGCGVLGSIEYKAGWASRGQRPELPGKRCGTHISSIAVPLTVLSLSVQICACTWQRSHKFKPHIYIYVEKPILYTFHVNKRTNVPTCHYWLNNSAWCRQTKMLKTLYLLLKNKNRFKFNHLKGFFLEYFFKRHWAGVPIVFFNWDALRNEHQPTCFN